MQRHKWVTSHMGWRWRFARDRVKAQLDNSDNWPLQVDTSILSSGIHIRQCQRVYTPYHFLTKENTEYIHIFSLYRTRSKFCYCWWFETWSFYSTLRESGSNIPATQGGAGEVQGRARTELDEDERLAAGEAGSTPSAQGKDEVGATREERLRRWITWRA